MDQSTPRIIDLDRYCSPEEYCVAAGISYPNLQRRINSGRVKSIKIGPARLIEKPAVTTVP